MGLGFFIRPELTSLMLPRTPRSASERLTLPQLLHARYTLNGSRSHGLDETAFRVDWYTLMSIFQVHQACGHEVCTLQYGIALGTLRISGLIGG